MVNPCKFLSPCRFPTIFPMIFPPFHQGAILGIQRLRFHPGPREAHLGRGIHAGRQGAAEPHGHVDFEDLARWPGYWQWDFAGMIPSGNLT